MPGYRGSGPVAKRHGRTDSRHAAFAWSRSSSLEQCRSKDPRHVRTRAVDGFTIGPHLLPFSLDDIVGRLGPELAERGVYRTAYEATTLRTSRLSPATSPSR